jgi:hypothetical protein
MLLHGGVQVPIRLAERMGDVFEGQPEPPQEKDAVEPLDVLLAIHAVARSGAARRGQEVLADSA